MIRSFADKMKVKQEAYQAEQQELAEQAEKDRKAAEWELFEQGQKAQHAMNLQILAEEESRKHAEYLNWKQEQKILQEQVVPAAKVEPGLGMGHIDTWVLTWKSFSSHPDIVNLPMSEKIRLFKLAEQQQIQKLNYYANLHAPENVLGGADANIYWTDGEVGEKDFIPARDAKSGDGWIIDTDVYWSNSVDVTTTLVIQPGVTVTVDGILTTNARITNYGTLIVNGLIVENVSISNLEDGRVIVT